MLISPGLQIGLSLLATAALACGSSGSGKDGAVLESIKDLSTWKTATFEPVFITAAASAACIAASLPAGPHSPGYIEVCVNKVGFKAFLDPAKKLPIGSVVVKKKHQSYKGAPELMTVMVKTADKGRTDDWRFYAVSGDGKKELATDPSKCRKCHESAGKDHLFRSYQLVKK